MDEVGSRISRYLGMFVLVNSTYGLIIGVGLAIIGVPYAVLWGLPGRRPSGSSSYVGPASAFLLPFVFSIAQSDGWREPLMVLGLFGVLEILANSFLEPVIYGKTTGVSALGLLVAALVWTWLWGLLGLLLSTPLTVCLAVLGKYVPSLEIFSKLLGEEAELEQDVRWVYQAPAGPRSGTGRQRDRRRGRPRRSRGPRSTTRSSSRHSRRPSATSPEARSTSASRRSSGG